MEQLLSSGHARELRGSTFDSGGAWSSIVEFASSTSVAMSAFPCPGCRK